MAFDWLLDSDRCFVVEFDAIREEDGHFAENSSFPTEQMPRPRSRYDLAPRRMTSVRPYRNGTYDL